MTDRFSGRNVVITGRLSSMTHREAEEEISARGGHHVHHVARSIDIVVLGQEGSPLAKDGGLTQKLRRARELKARGTPVEFLTEDEFLEALGLPERETRLYTTTQLSRILDVPGATIRKWLRQGLVSPVRTENRLSFFDFAQVAAAKAVAKLVGGGVTPERICESLGDLRRFLPEAETPFHHLGIEQWGPELLVRLESGQLADAHGQLRFDFDATSRGAITRVEDYKSAESWFQDALRYEDTEDLEHAIQAYRRAILLDATLVEARYNLGNVLYALGRTTEAAEQFGEAVAIDPNYLEAWNNLGNVLSDLERFAEAVGAYERALALEPFYADAHYNLGETLFALGRLEEARRHWRAYLIQDPDSAWADHVRDRLRDH